jgi:hypothetical protein
MGWRWRDMADIGLSRGPQMSGTFSRCKINFEPWIRRSPQKPGDLRLLSSKPFGLELERPPRAGELNMAGANRKPALTLTLSPGRGDSASGRYAAAASGGSRATSAAEICMGASVDCSTNRSSSAFGI